MVRALIAGFSQLKFLNNMKKGGKLGRLELLGWINELTESDYPRIESLSDGIGYCQVLDLLHPKTVPLIKLNCRF